MANLKATIKGNISQCILSAGVLLLIIAAFIFVRDMALFFILALGAFGCMAAGAIVLNLQEMKRAKAAITRINESRSASRQQRTLQFQKLTFFTMPAPKYDEYLIGALLQGPEPEPYIFLFSKEVDGSAPIRKKLRQQLLGKPLNVTCMGKTGVIDAIEGFSLEGCPSSAYRPSLFPRRNRK